MSAPADSDHVIEIDLRSPGVAALWAWLWPGAGHIYQRRYGKGALFMICILTTYFFGLAMGGGHVVYASWTKTDRRWQYICQAGAGIPSFPALVQSYRVFGRKAKPIKILGIDGFMAPPTPQPVIPESPDTLSDWHKKYNFYFELGTLYTMVAGLLNILAIYDAYAGPVVATPEERDKPPPDDEDLEEDLLNP